MRLFDADKWAQYYSEERNRTPVANDYEAGQNDALDRVDTWMEEQPTIEAAPVVHGRWKYGTRAAVCSGCGFERHLDDNFGAAVACPNCGARMDGDSKAPTTPTTNHRVCKNCKTAVIGMEEYAECPECGHPFEEDANG